MQNNGSLPRGRIGWALLHMQLIMFSIVLRTRNLVSRRTIVGDTDVDVTLTSYGSRTHSVWQTIETIGSGSAKPRRIILYLDDEVVVGAPPKTLTRLVARGLELSKCYDFGPHKKYFPYVKTSDLSRPLVTADDDVFYPRHWLSNLVAAHRQSTVTAYRARLRTNGRYADWPLCTSDEASDRVFATGVSGVLYPPELLKVLRAKGDEFMAVCPRADDFWLHFAAVSAGIPVRQVGAEAAHWWPQLGTNKSGLWLDNMLNNANDQIASATEQAWLGP